jgi:hypothetical protein
LEIRPQASALAMKQISEPQHEGASTKKEGPQRCGPLVVGGGLEKDQAALL